MRAKLLRASLALVVAATLACSRGGGGADGDGDGDPAGTPTTADDAPFQRRDAVAQLNVALTGMNLVATEIGIRSFRAGGADYCRRDGPAELEPHRAKLEAAPDPTARQQAEVALGRLDEALKVCAGGGDSAAVQQALQRYRESFEPLLRTVEALVAAG